MCRTPSADSRGLISVVIPHYGDPVVALDLVGRLQNQSTSSILEIIVVDDCSPMPFPETEGVEVYRHLRNRGFGSAVNSGARRANGSLLLIMNSDLEPGVDFVRDLLGAATPFLPALCSPGVIEDGRWSSTAHRFPSALVWTIGGLMPLMRFASHPSLQRWGISDTRAQPGRDGATDWVAGACLLVRSRDFDLVGGFDESFYMYGEDIDLGLRLARAGVPSIFLGSVSVPHAFGASSDPTMVAQWNVEARVRYARKWGFGGRFVVGLVSVAFANFTYNVLRRAFGKDVRPIERLRYEARLIRWGLRA